MFITHWNWDRLRETSGSASSLKETRECRTQVFLFIWAIGKVEICLQEKVFWFFYAALLFIWYCKKCAFSLWSCFRMPHSLLRVMVSWFLSRHGLWPRKNGANKVFEIEQFSIEEHFIAFLELKFWLVAYFVPYFVLSFTAGVFTCRRNGCQKSHAKTNQSSSECSERFWNQWIRMSDEG